VYFYKNNIPFLGKSKLMSIDKNTLKELLTDLESDRIERTVSTDNTDKFSQAICAFANDYPNHNQAGYLLIGVKDNGELSNLKVTDKLMLDLAAIRTNGNVLPQPAMIITKYTFDDGEIAIVEVQPSVLPPVRYKGKVWIRIGPSKAVANETEEKKLIEKRATHAKTFDALPCIGSNIDDLSITSFLQEYLPNAIDEQTLRENNRDLKQKLASLRMFDPQYDCPTNAGILTFGIDPLRFFYGDYIQYVKFNGISMVDPVEAEKQFRGNLVTTLRNVDDFLKNNIIKQKPVFVSVLREEQVYNYPYRAIRELLLNAIMHRNYESNSPVRFYEFSDRIEIQNPGYLYGEANARNFPSINAYRNPIIAEVMKNLGYVNRFNVGVKMAKDELLKNGNPEPKFDLSLETNFLVITFLRSTQ
jgi:ATP-dependent DNA helicase RecG